MMGLFVQVTALLAMMGGAVFLEYQGQMALKATGVMRNLSFCQVVSRHELVHHGFRFVRNLEKLFPYV